jgi:hypothetical protein
MRADLARQNHLATRKVLRPGVMNSVGSAEFSSGKFKLTFYCKDERSGKVKLVGSVVKYKGEVFLISPGGQVRDLKIHAGDSSRSGVFADELGWELQAVGLRDSFSLRLMRKKGEGRSAVADSYATLPLNDKDEEALRKEAGPNAAVRKRQRVIALLIAAGIAGIGLGYASDGCNSAGASAIIEGEEGMGDF